MVIEQFHNFYVAGQVTWQTLLVLYWPLLCDELPSRAALTSAAQKQTVQTVNYKWVTGMLALCN
jgi:hypothetical protein